MNQRWLQGLPSLCMGLLLLAGCQVGQDSPSEPLGRALDGAAPRCRGDNSVDALNRERSLFPDDERQRQVVDICQDIMDGVLDPDLGADQLHVMAYNGVTNDDLGNPSSQDLAEFNAAVRALTPVAALDPDEQPVWNTTNIDDGQFLAVGPTTANDVHCFGSGLDTWCFQVDANQSYFFMAEAKAPTEDLGACPGVLANDCEDDVIHVDVNPDEAIDEDNRLHVWSCTEFANGHARFGFELGVPDSGAFGLDDPTTPQAILDACASSVELNGLQKWAWSGLKPLRWAAGVGTANAGTGGTTFARGSLVAEGEEGLIRVRDIVCKVTSKYASVSDGTECRLFLNSSLVTIPGQIGTTKTTCTTQSVPGVPKTGQCTWEDIPVPDDVTYYAVIDKQDQTGTAHHFEANLPGGLSPGDPARDEIRVCTFNLAKKTVGCVTVSL